MLIHRQDPQGFKTIKHKYKIYDVAEIVEKRQDLYMCMDNKELPESYSMKSGEQLGLDGYWLNV